MTRETPGPRSSPTTSSTSPTARCASTCASPRRPPGEIARARSASPRSRRRLTDCRHVRHLRARLARRTGPSPTRRRRGDERDARPPRPRQRRALRCDGPVALAARRLSIIDLAGGDQPIGNEDGRVQVVQNGEIYNYRELRGELERPGHRFATRQRHRGARPPLRGARRRLRRASCAACSRSRSGTGASAGCCWRATASASSRSTTGSPAATLSFASELKALLAPAGLLARDRPRRARGAYLAFNSIPAPLTIFAEARKLPAGPPAVWQRRRRQPSAATPGRSRWRPARFARAAASELAAELRERLRDSVRAHLVADVPVGVLLSGGIDSSALAALAARESPATASAPSRSASRRAPSTSWTRRAWSPSATAPTTTSWSCARTRSSCCRSWPRPSTSRSPTPRRCPPISSRARRRRRSRWRCPARAATSSSAATTPTSPTRSPRASAASRRCAAPLVERLPSSDGKVELRLQGEALRARGATCRRSSATTPGRRSSRRSARAALLTARATRLGPARPLPRALRRDRGRRASWRGSRTSTSASTWSTTCW